MTRRRRLHRNRQRWRRHRQRCCVFYFVHCHIEHLSVIFFSFFCCCRCVLCLFVCWWSGFCCVYIVSSSNRHNSRASHFAVVLLYCARQQSMHFVAVAVFYCKLNFCLLIALCCRCWRCRRTCNWIVCVRTWWWFMHSQYIYRVLFGHSFTAREHISTHAFGGSSTAPHHSPQTMLRMCRKQRDEAQTIHC